jgi:hypothetical protein
MMLSSRSRRRSSLASLAIGASILVMLSPAGPARAQTPPPPTPAPTDVPSAAPPAQVVTPGAPVPAPVYVQPVYPPGYVVPAYPPSYAQPMYPPVYAQPGYAPPGSYAPGYAPPQRRRRSERLNPDDPPPGYHTESRVQTGLIVGGALTFGIPYVLSATAAASSLSGSGSMYEPLFIPIVGPFITLSSAHVFAGTNDAATQVARVFGGFGLVLDGLIQLGGATLLIVGIAVPREVVVRDAAAMPELSFGPTGASARWVF